MLPHVPSFLLLFPLFAFPLLSQSNTNKKGDYKLTVSVDLVGVLATVTTTEGALVSGLKSTDFHLYENGQLQEIAVFSKEADQPLRLCLLFDSSASIASALKTQQDAAIEFLQSIFRPRIDRVSIFQFSEEVQQLTQIRESLGAAQSRHPVDQAGWWDFSLRCSLSGCRESLNTVGAQSDRGGL